MTPLHFFFLLALAFASAASEVLEVPASNVTSTREARVVAKIEEFDLIKTPLSWQAARDYCRQQGFLGLLRFDSPGMLRTVYQLMRRQNAVNNYEIWTDSTDVGSPGTFTYAATRQPLYNFGFHAWGEGEPNNLEGKEHCMGIVLQSDTGRLWWNDQKCDVERPFACMK